MAPDIIRSRQPARLISLCPAQIGMPVWPRTCGHVEAVAVPAHRLLEPADVLILHQPRELHGLAQRIALVGIDRQYEILADGRARRAHPLGILLRRAPAHLELAAGIARGS